MGRAPAVLARRRTAVLAALVAAIAAYEALADSLWTASAWPDVAWISVVVIPAVFAIDYLLLPIARARGLFLVAVALGALTAIAAVAGLGVLTNLAKFGAVTVLAFWLLGYFETIGIVVIVAAIIPWVDAYSVWRGPTHDLLEHRPAIFGDFSVGFPGPGPHDTAGLGLPDVLFFALFLAAAAQFRLRVGWTWLAMTLSFGATLAISVWLGLGGLPALPGLSIGFLVVNADLIWRRLRPKRA